MEKTYQITLIQLEALLKRQKHLCAEYLEYSFTEEPYKLDHMVNYAPTPDLSHLKEVKNDVTNDKAQDLTLKEIIEQSLKIGKVPLLTFEETFSASEVEKFIRTTISETAQGCLEFFEKDSVIKDKEGNVLPDACIHLVDNPLPLTERIYPRLEKHGIKFNSGKSVQECDANTLNRGSEPMAQNKSAEGQQLTECYAEIESLKAWKESATKVMPDFQEIAKLLNIPLGASVSEQIIPKIKELKETIREQGAQTLDLMEQIMNYLKRK